MKKILNRIGKIISSAIFAILLLIVFWVIGYLIKVKIYSSQGRLGEIRLNFYTIISPSMTPTIKAGDIIVTYKNLDDKYNTEDIITFISTGPTKGATITHRITEIYALDGVYAYKTKGDANNAEDGSLVPEENVIGKVVFKIPKAGYIQQFLVTGPGWVIAIVIPCLGIIIFDIVKLVRKAGKKELEKIKEKKQSKTAQLQITDEVIKSEPESLEIISDAISKKNDEIDNEANIEIIEEIKPDTVITALEESSEIISFDNENKSSVDEQIELLDDEPVNKFDALRKDTNNE